MKLDSPAPFRIRLLNHAFPPIRGNNNASAAYFQPGAARQGPADILSVQHYAGLPQDPAHGEVVTLTDIESVTGLDDLRSAECGDNQPRLGRSQLIGAAEEQRDARVRVH